MGSCLPTPRSVELSHLHFPVTDCVLAREALASSRWGAGAQGPPRRVGCPWDSGRLREAGGPCALLLPGHRSDFERVGGRGGEGGASAGSCSPGSRRPGAHSAQASERPCLPSAWCRAARSRSLRALGLPFLGWAFPQSHTAESGHAPGFSELGNPSAVPREFTPSEQHTRELPGNLAG